MSLFIIVTNKVFEYLEVPFTSALAVSLVSLTDIEFAMKLLILTATLWNVIWKSWANWEERKQRKQKEKEDQNAK